MSRYEDENAICSSVGEIIVKVDSTKVDIKLYQRLLRDLESLKSREEKEEADIDLTDFMLIEEDLLSIQMQDINENNINEIANQLKYKIKIRCSEIIGRTSSDISSIEHGGGEWETDAVKHYKEIAEKIAEYMNSNPVIDQQNVILFKEIYDKLKAFRLSYYKILNEKSNPIVRMKMAANYTVELDNLLKQLENIENNEKTK